MGIRGRGKRRKRRRKASSSTVSVSEEKLCDASCVASSTVASQLCAGVAALVESADVVKRRAMVAVLCAALRRELERREDTADSEDGVAVSSVWSVLSSAWRLQ